MRQDHIWVWPDIPLNEARPHHRHQREAAMYHYRILLLWFASGSFSCLRPMLSSRMTNFRPHFSLWKNGRRNSKTEKWGQKKVGPDKNNLAPLLFDGKTAAEIKKTEVGPVWAPRGIIIKGSKTYVGPTSRLGCFVVVAAGALCFRSNFWLWLRWRSDFVTRRLCGAKQNHTGLGPEPYSDIIRGGGAVT